MEGIELEVSNAASITVYKGENTTGQPQTELASTEVITENGLAIIAFDATTFGNDDADRLVIAVEQDGTNTPTIDEDEYFAKMIAFPDAFFNNIIPTRQDRGGGVMELADGTQMQYEGFGGKKWRWQLTARFVKTAISMTKDRNLLTHKRLTVIPIVSIHVFWKIPNFVQRIVLNIS